MAGKSRLLALLTQDHLRLAKIAQEGGDREKAAELYARGGDHGQAARLYAELRDEPRAIEQFFQATLGATEGYSGAGAQKAGELIAAAGHHEEAITLFEMAGAYRQAAGSALKLKQPAQAARYYERAKAWPEAAIFYQQANQPQQALRVLELESGRLAQETRGSRDAALEESRRKVDLQRAEIMARLGRSGEGAALLSNAPATPKSARLLEEAGRYAEAVDAYLRLDEPDQALRLVTKTPDIDRRLAAQVYLRCGRPLEAGHLLAALGLAREAAEAYEAGLDWARAGSRWEAARDPLRAAHAYLRADRPRDAGRSFAAAGNPSLAAASYAKAGDRDAAVASYLKAGQAVEAASLLLAAGERTPAAKTLMQVSAQHPDLRRATLLLAPLLVEENLYEDALRRLRALPAAPAADAPEALDALYWEARALEGLRREDEAVAAYRRLLTGRAEHGDAARRLAALEDRSGETRVQPAADATRYEGVRPAVPGGDRSLGPGQLLAGRYDILAELGRGGMGRVFKAHDRELGETVAIKTLLSRGEAGSKEEERLLREVQICRKITHPNVVRVYDLGRFAGGIFITMEYLEGERLDSLIDPARPLPPARVKLLLGEITTGLGEAHALGIVHRDLKPGNVMLTAARLKILDFGIAHVTGADVHLTQTGFAVGSPLYMSPEQIQGEPLDGRSDLYSLGVLAFALLAGREPFQAATPATIAIKHLQEPAPDVRRFRPELPAAWAQFLERLLAKSREARFAGVREVTEALAALPG